MWAYDRTFYQIYPLGFCNAPFPNDGKSENRLKAINDDYIAYLKDLGIGALLFNPLFMSDNHGYDTVDFRNVDNRLGTNEDLKALVDKLHKNDIRVVLDGVFNHVGRGSMYFQDLLKNRESSPYKDWFYVNFGGNNGYNDGLWYEGWEGHFELVKLNLQNPAVCDYLIDTVKFWIDEFDIDGLRLDVSYCLDKNFIKRLRYETASYKNDFYLMGEILGGDYKTVMADDMCHSATNYECYKGLHSSMNSYNLFEIVHSLKRQFGPEDWTLYKGMHLFSFVDNHDVTRVASILQNRNHLPLIYALMFFMPGIPSIYYGSEWGMEGKKEEGDPALRPAVSCPSPNNLTEFIKKLISIHADSKALRYGDFSDLLLTNRQCVLQRCFDGERILLALNIDENSFRAHFNAGASSGVDLLSGKEVSFSDGLELPGYSAIILRCH